MTPAQRLVDDIENGRTHAIAGYLLEYLAHYGTEGIDAQALARRVIERYEEE